MDSDIIYHYTSVHGASGILQSGKIWASDILYLNDSNELTKSKDIFNGLIKKEYGVDINLILQQTIFSRSYCAFCLSKSHDILSQWRAYANDGKGLCLGFQKTFIANKRAEYNSEFVDCIYEDHEEFILNLIMQKKEEINELISFIDRYQKNLSDFNIFSEARLPSIQSAIDSIYIQLARLKNFNFSEEKESRLIICVPKEKTNKRVFYDVIVPYVEYQLCDTEDDYKNPPLLIPEIFDCWLM